MARLFQIQQLFWGVGRVGPNSRYGRRFQTNSGLFKAHYDAEFHPTQGGHSRYPTNQNEVLENATRLETTIKSNDFRCLGRL